MYHSLLQLIMGGVEFLVFTIIYYFVVDNLSNVLLCAKIERNIIKV